MVKSDADLLLDFQTGNEDAFDRLIKRHHVGVYNFFYRLTGQHADAEDLTQEVFLKVFRHANRYRPTARFTTYLYRIAKNAWLDRYRKYKRTGPIASLDQPHGDGLTLHQKLPDTGAGPSRTVMQREQGDRIQAAIDALPEGHRVVFVLGEVQQMPYAEIAETLDIPLGTVKSRMHHAVQKLRKILRND